VRAIVRALRKPLLALPLLVAAPLSLLGQEPRERNEAPGSAYVVGTVTIRGTEDPLPGAQVALTGRADVPPALQTTGERGAFRFSDIAPRSYTLRITFLGYKPVEFEFSVRDGDEVRVDVEMVRGVVALEPIVVTATRQSLLRRVGFVDRQRSGIGRFMDREDIRERNPFRVTDLLRTMPGWRVTPGPRGHGNLILGRGSCIPAMYVDGARLIDGTSIDEVLNPETIEAIEVYHASQAPAQYQGTRCGSVVAWSRDPGQAEGGSPFTLKRLLTALGFLAVAITATSL
jgi:hypothetical protein